MLLKSALAGSALALITSLPAFAQDCGRWVACPRDGALSREAVHSYVHGRTPDDVAGIRAFRDAARSQPVASGEQDKAATGTPEAPAEDVTEASAAELAAEEAAARAYLAELDAQRASDSPFGLPGRVEDSGIAGVRMINTGD